MSDVQKFNYFKEYRKGEAYLCVENLELTAVNNIAIAELKRVYAKPQGPHPNSLVQIRHPDSREVNDRRSSKEEERNLLEAYPKKFQDLEEGWQPYHKETIATLRPVLNSRDRLIRITGRVDLALRDRDIGPVILCPFST
ncbi:hypothetical protein OUZ56_003526 [Daphnia magna]|uniref:Uncharacterized protein n=1 Tax=Daphnia magna TaxID=35525 RepID=A0ABR0A907_9CRUS|nr:hypothetical protein OUZ56_003526 [Daphnia magna]